MNTFLTAFPSSSQITANTAQLDVLQEGYISLLDGQSLIRATGEDAASFLHNQLSNDVNKLSMMQMQFAAFCTPKGRMQASLQIWKDEQGVVLQCASSLQPAFQKRIQMFIMRSKAKLEDVTESHYLIGVGGKNAAAFLQNYFPQLPVAIYDKTDSAAGSLIRMSDGFEQARYQWMISKDAFAQLSPTITTTKALQVVDASVWRLADILAGIPQVIDKTKEQFVPQMINFELIGGVNFKKGCYPGQEIVARSQYLGKLKRRMAIATIASQEIAVGMEVFSDNDTTQPCGMIVNCESYLGQGSVCLVELKLADQEEGKVHLEKSDGAVLHFLPLPYAYLDITE